MTKVAFILSMPKSMDPADVVTAGAKRGLKFKTKYVRKVRHEAVHGRPSRAKAKSGKLQPVVSRVVESAIRAASRIRRRTKRLERSKQPIVMPLSKTDRELLQDRAPAHVKLARGSDAVGRELLRFVRQFCSDEALLQVARERLAATGTL